MAATGGGFLAGLMGQLKNTLLRSGAAKQGVGGSSLASSTYKAHLQALRQSIALRQAGRRAVGKETYKRSGDATNTNRLLDAYINAEIAAQDAFKEALTNVFRGVRQGSDLPGAKQARQLVRELKGGSGFNQSRHTFSQSLKRPSAYPYVNAVYTRSTTDVGLQLSRGFHSGGMGFEIMSNAPLALRAAADDLEKERQKMRRKAGAARSVNMPMSTRRSPYMNQKRNVFPVGVNNWQAEVTHGRFFIIRKIEEKSFNEISEVEPESLTSSAVNVTAGPSSESTSVLDEESESGSDYFKEEEYIPYCTTMLNIPLNPDQHRLLFDDGYPDSCDGNDSVPFDPSHRLLSDRAFTQAIDRLYENFQRHRTGLICQIERAFDVDERLRTFRPASWNSALFVRLQECIDRDNSAEMRNVVLRIDFPDQEPDQVREMLEAARISERYVKFLMRNSIVRYRNPPNSKPGSSQYSSEGRSSTVYLPSPSASSEGFFDVGEFRAGFGVASNVSMDGYISSPMESQHTNEDQENVHQLIMPTLVLDGSHVSESAESIPSSENSH